jgi:hypothetical protein
MDGLYRGSLYLGESIYNRSEDTINPQYAEIKNQTGGYYNGSSINETTS